MQTFKIGFSVKDNYLHLFNAYSNVYFVVEKYVLNDGIYDFKHSK